MGAPVIHFEISAKDAPKMQSYYSELFGWEINADNPMRYGTIDDIVRAAAEAVLHLSVERQFARLFAFGLGCLQPNTLGIKVHLRPLDVAEFSLACSDMIRDSEWAFRRSARKRAGFRIARVWKKSLPCVSSSSFRMCGTRRTIGGSLRSPSESRAG